MARLVVRLTPRGGRDRIEGWARDALGRAYLKVRVASPAVEGRANAALERLIAKALDRPVSDVMIVAGDLARTKQLHLDGVDDLELARAFGNPQLEKETP